MYADAARLDIDPDLEPLYGIDALRAIEAEAAALLGDAFVLMARAGQAAWREALARWPEALRIVVACGPGNNGGDGYVFARHALDAGRDVRVLRLAAHAPRSTLARRACDAFVAAGGCVSEFDGAMLDGTISEADLVVDAVFGIGLARAPDGAAAALLEAINASHRPLLALDVPSGVDAGCGAVPGVAVRATRTIEFIAAKRGLATGRALGHAGVRSLATLALPPSTLAAHAPSAERLRAVDIARWLRPRPRDTHKGAHGRVLCIGGARGGGGAIALCAQAGLRSGAGLVDVLTDARHVGPLLARLPEAMAHAFDEVGEGQALDALLAKADVIAIGPGLGQDARADALLARAIAAACPMVIDADALNLLAMNPRALPSDCVLTPHPGEAARLLATTSSAVQADRYAAAAALCARFDATIVLKGAGTVVAASGRVPRVIDAGNPGMAVGGMGDVLCGVIAALRAQGLPAFDAASAGALLHAAAGDRAAGDGGERGLLPTDLMPWLRRLANPETAR